ncbi:6113_t:CDS:2, partial [Racocetra fulgida]
DDKVKLESLYKDAIKQASHYNFSISVLILMLDGLNMEENPYKKRRSQEITSGSNKAKKSKVAAKQPKDKDIEENWILATIVGYRTDLKSYEVEDADKDEASNRPGERFLVPAKNVIAIPNPGEMRSPEFPKDSTVIALYPSTTCFYRAVVVIPPSKLTPKSSRYLLTFEDDENAERYVEAHYVLDIPKER